MNYQNFEYFVESLIKNYDENNFKLNGINFKSSASKAEYQKLVQDKELHKFYLKKKNKFFFSKLTKTYLSNSFRNRNFSIKFFSFSNIEYYFRFSEIPFFIKHFIINLRLNFLNYKTKKKKIIVYVNTLKHFYHQKNYLKSIKNKISFITFSGDLINSLPKKDIKYFQPLILVNPSFKFHKKPLSKELYLYKVFKRFFSENSIKLVIGVEGDCPIFDILCKVSSEERVKSVCVQWGTYPFIRPRYTLNNMSCNYFLTWGDFFQSQLKSKNKKVKFISTGMKSSKKKIKKENLITFIMAPPVPDLPEKFNFDLLEISEDIAKNYKNWNCVIRNHPIYKISQNQISNIKNLKIEDYENNPIDNSLKKSSIVVGICSSVLIESLYYDTIPIVYEANKNLEFFPKLDQKKIGFLGQDVNTVKKLIEKLIVQKKKLAHMQKMIKNRKKLYFVNINKNIDPIIKKKISKICNS